jgi:hypothetical protein
MDIRRIRFILWLAVLFLTLGLVAKSDAGTPATPAGENVVRVHWVGLKQIISGTNATRLLTVLNMPESRRFEQQTLAKLAQAPWRWLRRNVDTNAAALLRPLVDDVVSNESCLFIRQNPGQPAQLAFVIRLDDQRAALWRFNLGQVLKSLTGITPEPAPQGRYGWSLRKHHAPNLIELSRAGAWTLVGMSENSNGLFQEQLARLQRSLPPMVARDGDDWLEADLDPAHLVPALSSLFAAGGEIPAPAELVSLSARASGGEGRGEVGSTNISSPNHQPSTLNHLYLSVTGNGTNILTRGTADFSRPLSLQLEPWIIPTNLVADPLTEFTLARGFKPWLESSATWTNLPISPAPDQLCFWAMKQFPMECYFSVPLTGADNQVARLSDWLLRNEKIWFATNALVRYEKSVRFNGLEWRGAPFVTLFLRSITANNQGFLYGGGLSATVPGTLSLDSVQSTISRTNLVYHDWEDTGPRVDQWLYMTQFVRFTLRKGQLPSGVASVLWLKAAESKLGDSVTDVTQTGPAQLSLTRRSDTGFTALELNLLADWLESPQFPRSLYSLLTPPSI